MFAPLVIMSAMFVAFAHGSNDVGNAVGPLAGTYNVWANDSITKKVDVPLWSLGIGAASFAIGIACYGSRTIETMGKNLPALT